MNDSANPNSPRLRIEASKWAAIIPCLALLANLVIAVWYFRESGDHQRLSSESDTILRETDSLSIRLQGLEAELAAHRAKYRRTMSQFMSIVSQMHGRDIFPVTDGPAIVSSAKLLNVPPEMPHEIDRGDNPVRLTCYIPKGNHRLIHGFRFDSDRCKLELPDRVVHPTRPGEIHKVTMSVRKENGVAILVISPEPRSSDDDVKEYRLGDDAVWISWRRARSWYRIPNENPGLPDLLEYEIPWNCTSDLPNQILWLDVTDGKNKFELRFGVESDAPASALALILASRSRDFLQRVSGEYKPPSDAEIALQGLLGGPGRSVPERTPPI